MLCTMAKQIILGFTIFLIGVLFFQAVAQTDDLEVQALRDLYRALNSPAELKNWKLEGGDPCEESWTGVSCHQSSVIEIKLEGLSLTGNLGHQLVNLKHLKHLDLSSNHFYGEIPNSLPQNLTDLNLACNNFTQSIPDSVSSMKHLRHLNLSQNLLSGPLADVFGSLENLIMMDLSHNNFSRDLPASFRALKNLARLYLQSNEFTGSVIFLADLHLHDLNIEDNHFSGVIPESFQNINSLWIGGNQFHVGESYPPWKFPTDVMPNEQNMSSPPTTESSAIEKYPSHESGNNRKKRPGSGGIVIMVIGAVLTVIGAAVFIAIRTHRSRKQTLDSLEGSISSLQSLPISAPQGSLAAQYDSPDSSSSDSPPLISPWQLPPAPTMTLKMSKRRSFSRKCKIPICAKLYTVAELQLATSNFSPVNLLGEGTLGSVYRADFPDGQILAVKNIKTVTLSITEEEQFMEVIRTASLLRHPNIVALIGYSVGHGNHLLVYEYVRNVTLDDALHNVLCMPLTWSLRLHIAIGIARALNYLHTCCVPPITHSNLKAANILLDEDLNPRICDCGLAILRPLASNSVKIKASEMAIADSGYVAPEHVKRPSGNPKADIYSFGVLLLELLTGRRPFDSSKPKGEQSLVEWASLKLHDSESLLEMVDPTINRTIFTRALSSYADIISQCIQPQKEFRPQMAEVAQSLVSLLQKSGQEKAKSGKDKTTAEGAEVDPCERSFRSTNSRFFASPAASYYSI
ncbi:protein STRUBBELIG-RECEPTOR FAMILY 2 isoform X1 [Lycium barbarum]|uniref:protein STRUBBELIG-RECEPTOR FAMILY 2 isoform X1 n=1 Tax=Lycium barbarum TaxID=112863 RepID=UPI00293E5B23|nr:protein STRUBBELIG-RECEPTOR FAMILY 2 isoform X1 [Lycium barbarum]